jgi:hypothetical protein
MQKKYDLGNNNSLKFRQFLYEVMDNYRKSKIVKNKHQNLQDLEIIKFFSKIKKNDIEEDVESTPFLR